MERGGSTPMRWGDFYRTANVAVCASLYEGASNSVMEAMAAGQMLVTTVCGNAAEMHNSQIREYGESGIVLVLERSVKAFTEALEQLVESGTEEVLRRGALNRREIEERWSWDAWAERYREFFRMAL